LTLDNAKLENPVTNDKPNIQWVPVGSIQMTDTTGKITLHISTKKSAVRVDTVLLIKVNPAQAKSDFKRVDIVKADWQRGEGFVFNRDHASLAYQSSSPELFTSFEASIKRTPDSPQQWQTIKPDSDGVWQVDLAQPGWYDVAIKATHQDGRVFERKAMVAVLGEPVNEAWREKSVFGITAIHGDKKLINLAGGRWDRRLTTFYKVTEKDVADTTTMSQSVSHYDERDGLAYSGCFSFGMPLWSMELPEHYSKPSFGNPFYPAKDWTMVRDIVATYTRTKSLPWLMEMYNEPLAHWQGTPQQLVAYAKAVREGLKSVDERFKLTGPCLYSIRIGDVKKLAEAGLFEQLDGIAMHTYVDGTAPEESYLQRIIDLNDLLKHYGQQDKPVYFTEFGWTAMDGTWQPPVDRWTQAQYAARSLALAWSQGVDGMTYFCLQYKTRNLGEQAFSLIDEQDRPQPGYAAFAGVAKWFAGSTPIGHYQLTPTVHMVMGRRDGKLQIGLWDTVGANKVTLPFAILKAVDMFGATIDVQNNTLNIGPSPVYVEAMDADIAELTRRPMVIVTAMNQVAGELAWPIPDFEHNASRLAAGQYIGFVKVDGNWQVQPVDLVSPLHLSDITTRWPADSPTPQVVTTLKSNLGDVTQKATLWLEKTPEKTVTLSIPANSMRQVIFNLPDIEQAKQQQVTVVFKRPDGELQSQMLELTALAAGPDSNAGTWSDFTAWAPFGQAGDNAPANDCQGKINVSHDAKGLRVQVKVTDDEHVQTHAKGTPGHMWAQDSVQLALDLDVLKPWQAGVVGSGLAGHRVFEFTVGGPADGDGFAPVFCNRSYDPSIAANALCPGFKASVTRDGDVTHYDILMPWDQLGLSPPMQRGDVLGFAIAVNDVDPGRKAGRHGIRLFKGIAMTKDAKQFGKLWLH
jgi:nitrogen fixation protein FixH